ncbi:PA3496 family putative envelope integrity protein [Parahalioglobus pacificus]|uniref:Uncharacterized protein n=1 Tax=Parahalioglobus pacificus TaxID=930806 RepID=A0A918XIK5_9GAMM|nr:hypothetical protein [Halioglobus pacificus]NQY01720.1 hypothetical protein [Halieaceae bacterium]GHD33829.1 hypothetical protein GCM10007053_18810 [Halioglobus pacificus]
MKERSQEPAPLEPLDEVFEPVLGDMTDEELESLTPQASCKAVLAAKRRRAEQRLEEKRLQDELGDYDFEFDDL